MSTMINQEGTITLIDQARHAGCRVLASSYLQEVLQVCFYLSHFKREREEHMDPHKPQSSQTEREIGRNTLGVGVFLGPTRLGFGTQNSVIISFPCQLSTCQSSVWGFWLIATSSSLPIGALYGMLDDQRDYHHNL